MDTLLDTLGRLYFGYFLTLSLLIAVSILSFMLGRKFQSPRFKAVRLAWFLLLNITISYWIIFEGYFRFVYEESDCISLLQTHLKWTRHESLRTKNDAGFRDMKDYKPLRGKDNLVFLLGDSFLFGQGIHYDDTVAAILQKKSPQYNFMNLGLPGWNTADHRNTYSFFYSRGFKPAMVVLNYFPNDIDDDNERMMHNSEDSAWAKRLLALRFSYSLQFITARLTSYGSTSFGNYEKRLAAAHEGPQGKAHKDMLLEFLTQVRSGGSEVLVVVWPVLPTDLYSGLNHSARPLIINALKENGIDYFDMHQATSALKRKEQIANSFDVHPSAEVHKIAADAIARWISNSTTGN